jgi:hypothetical protein
MGAGAMPASRQPGHLSSGRAGASSGIARLVATDECRPAIPGFVVLTHVRTHPRTGFCADAVGGSPVSVMDPDLRQDDDAGGLASGPTAWPPVGR